MAKLLLTCDEYIYENKGRYYAQSQEWYDFYQRYLRVFDALRLVTRCKHEDKIGNSRIPLDKDSRIEFIPLPFFQGPKGYAKVYFEYGRILKKVANGCDAAVLRLPWTLAPRIHKRIIQENIPYACEVVYDAEDGWRGSKGIERFLWKKIDRDMRMMCNNADGVSCVTEFYLQKHYFPLSPSAFTGHYSSLSLNKSFYGGAKTFPKHRPIIVAHTANQIEFNGRKGHVQIIQALKKLKQSGLQVKARFAGKDYFGGVDKLTEYAKELGVSEMVEFVGYLDRTELNNFLSNADLYVMPTKAEGLPRVVIEAMSKGLPCVTTPVSGNPELISEHFLVDYYDYDTLAARIIELATTPDLYETTSKENFDKSWDYEASVLQQRRDTFYTQLKSRIHNKVI